MRVIANTRQNQLNFASAIQAIIDAKSSTATVYRSQVNSTRGTPTGYVQVGNFQCRIDVYRPSWRGGERVSEVGTSTQRFYLLLAKVGADKNGNVVDLKDQDTVVLDDGTKYRCLNVVKFGTNKIEAILNITG